jgi:hypothetical protein
MLSTKAKQDQSRLDGLEGFADARSRLEDRAFRAQLDRLCAMAQGRTI